MGSGLVLNGVSIVFAFLAAFFWFWSARGVPLPEKITSGWGGSGGTAQVLGDALRRQAELSAYGAICAAVSAISQAILLGRGLMV